MRVINISLSELETKMLLIGFEGENQITQVRIDAAEILTDYPNATPTLIVKPLFGFAYPVIVTKEGTDIVWEIDNSVLSFHGDGEIQLTFTQGTVIAKSYVGRIRIKRSLAVNGEKPDPIETWEQAATAKLAEVDAQIDELEDMVEAAEAAKDQAQGIVDDAAADIQAAGAAQVGNVNSAGTTQVGAVQAKGEEVLNSIPADYSTLSGDVTGLKSAISVSGSDLVDNKIFLITHKGQAFNSSGSGYMFIDITSPTTNASWNAYLIPCSANDVFTVFAVGGTTVYAWAFIDSSGNILSKSSGNATVEGAVITAPANTAYLVVNDKGGNSRVYSNQLYKKSIENKLKQKNDNCTFYIGNGGSASWSAYDESPVTLNLGSNDYIIIIDNEQYTIAVSDILTIASNAGMTVDQSNKKITYASFVLYFDIATHTPKITLGITTTNGKKAILENTVLFVGHYKSIRAGLLVDYMQEHRIESAEKDINDLETDVNAILAVSADVVPSYFESNLSAKIPEIIANMNETGQDGTSFVFITDLHWETNYKNSPSLVKRVLDKTSVKNVFCGGDIINQGEKAEMSEVFLDCINRFRFVPNLGFFPIARGNHDDNSNWSSSADIAVYSFDDNTVYNLYYSQFGDKVTRIGSNWAFYFDQEVIKTRYIFVDTKRNGLTIDYQAIINCLNEVSSGWHVIILMHFTLRNATTLFAGCDLLAHIVNAYNSRESGSYGSDYQTATYDFTNAVGKVDLIIGGHMHADYAMNADDTNNPSGVPIIATDTDSYRNSASIEGTVDSQCFDVVTVNYSAKTVKCVRIGRGIDRDFAY